MASQSSTENTRQPKRVKREKTLAENLAGEQPRSDTFVLLDNNEDVEKPPGKAKNTRAKKSQVDPTPGVHPTRTQSQFKIGAHISSAGGVENAIVNAAAIGAGTFALFLKSQRKWSSKDLESSTINKFTERIKKFEYDSAMLLPHGSYLVNLGNADDEKREKSYDCFLDDLRRCEQLGIRYYNFHPGSTVGSSTTQASLKLVADSLNRAHKATKNVVTVIENMTGGKNILGTSFEQLAAIISEVEDKSRVGVCLDTCHLFAAGYDIRTKEKYEETMTSFDNIVGISYLKGWHLNDSKGPLNAKKDRHENLGMGHIGLRPFSFIVRDTRLVNIPMVLETPSFEKPEIVWKKEIQVLYALSQGPEADDDSLASFAKEIKDAVGAAEKANPPKAKKAKLASKRKKAAESSEEDGDTDE